MAVICESVRYALDEIESSIERLKEIADIDKRDNGEGAMPYLSDGEADKMYRLGMRLLKLAEVVRNKENNEDVLQEEDEN